MKLPKFTKNFYFVSVVFLLAWMLFIDANDITSQIQLNQKRQALENEKAYYLEKIEEVKSEREALMSNDELIERFAREKYLMKKESEDLFVIVNEE
ncbi:MAG: septum formation initiator family protein [Bacteroidota bacterium]